MTLKIAKELEAKIDKVAWLKKLKKVAKLANSTESSQTSKM